MISPMPRTWAIRVPAPETMFGLPINPMTMAEVLDFCQESISSRTRALIGVVNAAKVVACRDNDELRDSLLECDIIVADGQSVVWASNFLQKPLPERVAGIDIFTNLLQLADERGQSVFLLGAKAEVIQKLVSVIRETYPGAVIGGARDGYFDEVTQGREVASEIRESGADMLFLGMTSPKKEIFLKDWGDSLGVPVLHGVGGSFDVLAGVTQRAPRFLQKTGMEWFYRFIQEPRRMWKRYLVTNSTFIMMTWKEFRAPGDGYERSVPAVPPRVRSA